MSYFLFLAIFLCIPIAALLILHRRAARPFSPDWSAFSPQWVIAIHVFIALIYTTPWDNYLVATSVWWYDPALVTGIKIGWVPIEEYSFFVLQPIMSGLLLLLIIRNVQLPVSSKLNPSIRLISVVVVGILWAVMTYLLLFGTDRWNYLGLELSWALIPILLQLGYGADILWKNRPLVALGIGIPTIYLAIADAIAIQSGTWSISTTQSLNWIWWGGLPFEEFVFFLLTNTLVVFGSTLMLSAQSRLRGEQLLARYWTKK